MYLIEFAILIVTFLEVWCENIAQEESLNAMLDIELHTVLVADMNNTYMYINLATIWHVLLVCFLGGVWHQGALGICGEVFP